MMPKLALFKRTVVCPFLNVYHDRLVTKFIFVAVVAISFNNDSNGIPFITVFESFYDFEKDKKLFRSVKNV